MESLKMKYTLYMEDFLCRRWRRKTRGGWWEKERRKYKETKGNENEKLYEREAINGTK
jgi:hypothetical protein